MKSPVIKLSATITQRLSSRKVAIEKASAAIADANKQNTQLGEMESELMQLEKVVSPDDPSGIQKMETLRAGVRLKRQRIELATDPDDAMRAALKDICGDLSPAIVPIIDAHRSQIAELLEPYCVDRPQALQLAEQTPFIESYKSYLTGLNSVSISARPWEVRRVLGAIDQLLAGRDPFQFDRAGRAVKAD